VVDRGLLNKLLEIGTYAPSAKNAQPWHWLVIQNPTEVKRLAGLVVDWIRVVIKEKPEIARQKAYHRVVAAWKKGKDPICREAPHLIVVHADKNWAFGAEDCASALTYIELFAFVMACDLLGGYFYLAANLCLC
jgi:nitroreductase